MRLCITPASLHTLESITSKSKTENNLPLMVDDQLHPLLLLEAFIADFASPALDKDTTFI
jgi:hypothetical protein